MSRKTRYADVQKAAEDQANQKAGCFVQNACAHLKSIRRMLEVDVHAYGFDEDRSTVFVVARMIYELHVESVKDTAPGVQGVVALQDVFASVIQIAVAEQ